MDGWMGSIDEVNMAGDLLTGPSILSLINCLMMMILSAKFVLCLLDRTFCCVALESVRFRWSYLFLERTVCVFMILACGIIIQLLSFSIWKPVIISVLNHFSNTTGMTVWLRCCVSLAYSAFLCYSMTMCISVNRGGWHLIMTLSDILHPYVHFVISSVAYCVYLCVYACVCVCVSLHF